MPNFKDDLAPDFDSPTGEPSSREEAHSWQDSNKGWWESHPMRYDFGEALDVEEFTEPFYAEIDRRFFAAAQEMMPWKQRPFDRLIGYESLADKKVLEIGVGNGSVAQLLAEKAGSFTGIDLTEYAVKSTTERFRLRGLEGDVRRMDAEHIEFEDASFDFVWTWGVIHHSSQPNQILREIHRVLRPGGRAAVMVYYRGWWNYYTCFGLIRGVLLGDLLRSRSLHQTAQNWTDGAIARFYSRREWREDVEGAGFRVENMFVCSNVAAALPLPGGPVKDKIVSAVPKAPARFGTEKLSMGAYLVSELRRD